jgi:hypothetical protein
MQQVKSDAHGGLAIALELFEVAEQMLRQRLRRENPSGSDEELETQVQAWRTARPGAEDGDSPGRPVPWPRRR